MRTAFRAAAALTLMVLGFVGPASAATNTTTIAQATASQATLTGRVTDSRGNALAGATITAQGAGTTLTATSDGSGSYTLTLPPGLYSVTVNHAGYQTAQNELAVTAGVATTANITMEERSLQSLQVIGRTSTTFNRTPFNVSEAPVSTLPHDEIAIKQTTNLTDTVATLPGVVVSRTFSATPNTNFVVRGAGLQTRVTIDGHPISSGIVGQWNTNYAISGIFENVEVVKGAGLNGSIAGESSVGTVNLRTRDFTTKNSYGFSAGPDSWGSGNYNAYADVNFGPQNRASLIVAKAFSALNGPWNDTFANRTGAISPIAPAIGQPPNITGLDQWAGDLSNRYSLQGELIKGRYRFSQTTSITGEFLGMQGQYIPQGGAYSTYNGHVTLAACQNGSAFQATLATCTASSTFEPPYEFSNIGATVDSYTWFPNSFIQNNEPQFAAELRTAYKNDTILFRPYTHLINRFISGVNENKYPGNGGGWNAVTNAANCQVKYLRPGTAGIVGGTGAAGPCFGLTSGPVDPAYIGSDTTGHVFATTNAAPVCSPTPPYTCFTTPTNIENDGLFGYSTPFSQPELDRLTGYTFTYIHPVGENTYSFSYDYRKDATQSASTDQTGAAAGCQFVIGSVKGGNVLQTNGPNAGQPFQPGCSTAQFAGPYAQYNLLPRSSIGVPLTVSQYSDFSLNGQWQITPRLQLALGNYYEIYRADAQIEDPAVLAAYAAKGNSNAAPVSLITQKLSYSHYDPHLGLQYRVNRNFSVRASAGSSITQPYPGLISGFGQISIPNAAAHNYTLNIPNVGLKPETTVSYDLGFDLRNGDGSTLSLDAYDLTVHNVFLSTTQTIPPVAGVQTFPDTQFLQTESINGPLNRNYGLELTLAKIPTLGFGYYLTGTLQRTFNDQLPLSLYSSNTSPGNANFLINGLQFGVPYAKAYGQLLYAGLKGTLLELGADYEGNNNSTFGPPYVIWDGAMRIPVGEHFQLQFSAQNLFNLNTGTALGRNLASQGAIQPEVYLSNGQLRYTGASTSLQAVPPRTFRMLLNFAMGGQ